MPVFIFILLLLAGFFGWWDLSHQDHLVGYATLSCFAVAIFIAILTMRRNKKRGTGK